MTNVTLTEDVINTGNWECAVLRGTLNYFCNFSVNLKLLPKEQRETRLEGFFSASGWAVRLGCTATVSRPVCLADAQSHCQRSGALSPRLGTCMRTTQPSFLSFYVVWLLWS